MDCVNLYPLTQLYHRNYMYTKKPQAPHSQCLTSFANIFFIQDGADLKGMKVMIKDLDDVLFRDVGGKIAADGRWDWLLTCINHAYISKYSNLYNTLAWQQNTFTPNIFLLVVTDGPS